MECDGRTGSRSSEVRACAYIAGAILFAAGGAMAFELRSGDFTAGGSMPVDLTCEGADRSPALAWTGAPPGTRTLALIVDDPDAPDPAAPKVTWVHWVAWDIPATTGSLPAGASGAAMPAGAREGTNDWKKSGYRGPCPPIGRHRYVHKLFALDAALGDLGTPTKAALEKAMAGHVLGRAELIGTYAKRGR
jgi:Raf kinase inhibitor-like YbhB/YbcL family protein